MGFNKHESRLLHPLHQRLTATYDQLRESMLLPLGALKNNVVRSHYFKTLWGKYRKRSKLLQPNQTLYSFRHTGAIEIYKRTGSLTVLQQAMGHASLAVSLGYLRNLEVPMLKVEDMPYLF